MPTVVAKITKGAVFSGIANATDLDPQSVPGYLKSDGSAVSISSILTTDLPTAIKTGAIFFEVDGAGVVISTGLKRFLPVPFACTITGWTLLADVAGAIVIDVWKDTYANFPPTDGDAMPGAGKEPTIPATNQKAQDNDVSDWTTVAISAGDILAFNVDSCATITKIILSLSITKA